MDLIYYLACPGVCLRNCCTLCCVVKSNFHGSYLLRSFGAVHDGGVVELADDEVHLHGAARLRRGAELRALRLREGGALLLDPAQGPPQHHVDAHAHNCAHPRASVDCFGDRQTDLSCRPGVNSMHLVGCMAQSGAIVDGTRNVFDMGRSHRCRL